MRQSIALAVLQDTAAGVRAACGETMIPQRNEAFLLKAWFRGIWNLGLLLSGKRRN